MPRTPRVVQPDVPMHITQRGVDRCPTFLAAEDYAAYLIALEYAQRSARCALHAYALMPNHVHLLVTPERPDGPATLMRAIGAVYVRYFNDRYRRTGTLWEGRFRSALVRSDHYFFACSRYIELNPVRAGLATSPEACHWTSHAHNALGVRDRLVRAHPSYLALGPSDEARREAYRELFAKPPDEDVVANFRIAPRARPALIATPYAEAVRALQDAAR